LGAVSLILAVTTVCQDRPKTWPTVRASLQSQVPVGRRVLSVRLAFSGWRNA